MLQCSLGKLDLLFHCSQYAEMVCSCVRLISGAIMVGLGLHYKKNEGEHLFWKGDPCPNGARCLLDVCHRNRVDCYKFPAHNCQDDNVLFERPWTKTVPYLLQS